MCRRDCPFVSSPFLKKSGKRKLLHQHSKLKWRHFFKKCATLSLSIAWTVKRLRTVPYIFYYDFFLIEESEKFWKLNARSWIINQHFLFINIYRRETPFRGLGGRENTLNLCRSQRQLLFEITAIASENWSIRGKADFLDFFLSKIQPGV